jgi:hypothetical protein
MEAEMALHSVVGVVDHVFSGYSNERDINDNASP